MDITYKFGRLWILLLPVGILSVFFKYLHQLNSILTSIEGVGIRKTMFSLFIAFFALWALIHLGSIYFVRAINWVWRGKISTAKVKPKFIVQKELKRDSKKNVESHGIKESEELFRLDLHGDSAA